MVEIDRTRESEKRFVLVVEDDAILSMLFVKILKQLGYRVVGTATNGEAALTQVIENLPDIVLMDIGLEGVIDGIEAAKYIFHVFNRPVVFVTAQKDHEVIERAKIAEPFGYLIKPFTDNELYSTIEIAMNSYEANAYNEDGSSKGLTKKAIRQFVTSKDGFLITDIKGRIIFMNPFAEHLLDTHQKEAFMKPLKQVVQLKDWESKESFDDLLLILEKERLMTLETASGTQRMATVHIYPVSNRKGETICFFLQLRQMFRGEVKRSY